MTEQELRELERTQDKPPATTGAHRARAGYESYQAYCQRIGITALSPMRYALATRVIGNLYPPTTKK
jgi:hypothetical protein